MQLKLFGYVVVIYRVTRPGNRELLPTPYTASQIAAAYAAALADNQPPLE